MNILTIVLPAVLVLLTAYLLLVKLLGSEEKRRNFELQKQNSNVITPLRLRAYERLMLVLERTAPNALVLNTTQPGITNQELHALLLKTIREEFSHNVSQQIYVTDELWNFICSAQESLIRLINTCAAKCQPNESGTKLAEIIIQVYGTSEQTPTEIAQQKLKDEVRALYR